MLLNFLLCKEALARLDDYLDRRLDAREMRLVEKHLRICRHCAQRFNFEKTFSDELRAKVGRVQASENLKTKIHNALENIETQSRNKQ